MKRNTSLILNILIVILEVIGLVVTVNINHKISYEYYTEDSNILAIFSSLLFVFYIIRKKDIPRWVQMFKYITTIGLTLTFLVVVFILAPMYNFNYVFLLFNNSLLYQHLLCPIISIITFIFFDDIDNIRVIDNVIGINLTIIYAVILIIFNILGLVSGPYPFLMVREQGVIISFFWLIIIIGLTYFIGFILRVLSNKFYLRGGKLDEII